MWLLVGYGLFMIHFSCSTDEVEGKHLINNFSIMIFHVFHNSLVSRLQSYVETLIVNLPYKSNINPSPAGEFD